MALAVICGCGYYSTSATGGTSLKSIAVPLFKNQTLEHGLEEAVTRSVVDAFVADNHLDVVAETEAESILWGTIVQYRRIPFSFDAQGAVLEYKLEIVAHVEYEDRKRSKTLWTEEDLRAWATYTSDPSAADTDSEAESPEDTGVAGNEEDGRQFAIEKLARELVAKTVGGW
jgi:hypothetical protein